MIRGIRVLIVNHSAELGGAELSLFDFVRSSTDTHTLFFEQGRLVDLLNEISIRCEILNAGSVLSLRRNDGFRKVFLSLPKLLILAAQVAVRMHRAEVVYANSQKALVVTALANAIVRRPLIWHLHDILTAEHFSKVMRSIAVTLSNRFVSHVIVNSESTADAYRQAGGKRPLSIVYNGIDPSDYCNVDTVSAQIQLRKEIGVVSGNILVHFGRLSAWKGQDIAVRALCHLPDCHLVLVGAALFGDADFEFGLRGLINELDVSERVHFLGFRVDVANLMAAADVVLHCSTSPEPFGRVIVEAMLAGKPVIASKAGGAKEIIADGMTGVLITPGDPAALSLAINVLLEDPEYAAQLGCAAKTAALHRFSLNDSVSKINAIINGLRRTSQ